MEYLPTSNLSMRLFKHLTHLLVTSTLIYIIYITIPVVEMMILRFIIQVTNNVVQSEFYSNFV